MKIDSSRLLSLVLSVLFAATLAGITAAAAGAATTGLWTGKVAYVNSRHIGVKAESQTRDFVLDSTTQYVEKGKTVSPSSVKAGITVTVSYTQSSLFGSTHATKVEIGGFSFVLPNAPQ